MLGCLGEIRLGRCPRRPHRSPPVFSPPLVRGLEIVRNLRLDMGIGGEVGLIAIFFRWETACTELVFHSELAGRGLLVYNFIRVRSVLTSTVVLLSGLKGTLCSASSSAS